jgi:arylformamidase
VKTRQTVLWLMMVLAELVVCSNAPAVQPWEPDLAYGADPKQRLDLSVPTVRGFSTVLFVHGGSLTDGDKADENYRNACVPFPAAGIACANVNYRLAPAHIWPAQADDVAAAVTWVQKNIASRGGDPHKLFLVGHSSGAMLVALVGTDERYLARHGLKGRDLRGIMPMGSIMWDDELEQALIKHGRNRVEEAFRRHPGNKIFSSLDTYLESWPIRHVRAGLPPFLFLIAASEQEQPPVLKTNMKFVEDARTLGNSAEYKVLTNRTHYSSIRNLSTPGDPVFEIVRDFIRKFSATAGK